MLLVAQRKTSPSLGNQRLRDQLFGGPPRRVSSPRFRPGSTLGLGLGAFFVSRLPLSLLPMEPNITRMTLPTEIHLVPSLKFNRNDVLNKYWDLAGLDPEKTKGNILGQLKALDLLCEELAQGEKPRPPATPDPDPDIYRAGWMPQAN